jgi:hypothetical protein
MRRCSQHSGQTTPRRHGGIHVHYDSDTTEYQNTPLVQDAGEYVKGQRVFENALGSLGFDVDPEDV